MDHKEIGGQSGEHKEVERISNNDVIDRCKMETKKKQDELEAKLNNMCRDWTMKMLEFHANMHYIVMS